MEKLCRIQQMHEMGLAQRFFHLSAEQNKGYRSKNEQVNKFIKEHLAVSSFSKASYFAYVLRITDLYSIFIVWTIGNGLALVVFSVEHVQWRSSVMKVANFLRKRAKI